MEADGMMYYVEKNFGLTLGEVDKLQMILLFLFQ